MVSFNGSEENIFDALNISRERGNELEREMKDSFVRFVNSNGPDNGVTKVDLIQYMSHLCVNINEYTLMLIWVLDFLHRQDEENN